jgi:phosphohistidine swiveling domain-containing protein
MSYLVFPSEFSSSPGIGKKTKNLKTLQDLELNVPKFIAIASEKITQTQDGFQALSQEIAQKFPANSYAVRSSALIEDAKNESFAGQFRTELNISSQNLAQALSEVIAQAREYLHGDLSKFSLLIQEFIEPDYAGIIFTRNPLGGREMVIEYHAGRGEEVVSGKVKPERLECYWNSKIFNATLPGLYKALEQAKKIEQHFQFPQDIEWCVKDDKWYWLQSRPITTISKVQYRQSLYLDEIVPKDQKFLYQKTEISEIAPRPTPLTLSLLQKIYSDQGPVSKVYKSYGTVYEARDFLKILGNELFVDREEELKTLLPAYSYVSSVANDPQIARIRGLGRTLKNVWNIAKINGQKSIDRIFENLKHALEKEENESSLSDYLQTLLIDYQIIFEINLLAGKAVEKITRLIKNEPITIPALLSSSIISLNKYQLKINRNWQGNSLEIADESKFVNHIEDGNVSGELKKWWENLSTMKKQILQTVLSEALTYNRFREYGRWLIVKKIQGLHSIVFNKAKELQYKDEKNSYFATLDEIMSGSVSEQQCCERKKKYDEYADFNLPPKISSSPMQNVSDKSQGVSPGIARGILVTREMIDRGEHKSQPKILYTPVLSPDLTRYFDTIDGVISESGGMLSHLAIIARERKMPVVVITKEFFKAKNGDEVCIDGERGTVDI